MMIVISDVKKNGLTSFSNANAHIERQRVMSQALCNHFHGAKEHGFPMENEHFIIIIIIVYTVQEST